MRTFIESVPKYTFFTGKGGVGKTSMACTTSILLAEKGNKVLLVSTDPASNLDEVLETTIGSTPTSINGVENLWAVNIDPIKAAEEYKERMVAPYRNILPEATIKQMEEQLSGACTVEIAGFNEFSRLLGDSSLTDEYDNIILDTAPTGHTLLLLDATQSYHREVAKSVSALPDSVLTLLPKLRDKDFTKIFIVALPESTPVHEAASLQNDLKRADIYPYGWIINKSFFDSGTTDNQLTLKTINEIKYISKVIDKYSKKTIVTPWSPEELQGEKSFFHYLNLLK